MFIFWHLVNLVFLTAKKIDEVKIGFRKVCQFNRNLACGKRNLLTQKFTFNIHCHAFELFFIAYDLTDVVL